MEVLFQLSKFKNKISESTKSVELRGKLAEAYSLTTQRNISDITHAELLFVYFSCMQATLHGLLKHEVSFSISCSYYELTKQSNMRRHVGDRNKYLSLPDAMLTAADLV